MTLAIVYGNYKLLFLKIHKLNDNNKMQQNKNKYPNPLWKNYQNSIYDKKKETFISKLNKYGQLSSFYMKSKTINQTIWHKIYIKQNKEQYFKKWFNQIIYFNKKKNAVYSGVPDLCNHCNITAKY